MPIKLNLWSSLKLSIKLITGLNNFNRLSHPTMFIYSNELNNQYEKSKYPCSIAYFTKSDRVRKFNFSIILERRDSMVFIDKYSCSATSRFVYPNAKYDKISCSRPVNFSI